MVDDELPLTGHLANASIQLLPSPPTTNGIGIQRYIKFKLDTAASNYNKWHNFFLFVLTKYDARDHVRQETSPHLATAEWRVTDVDIVMWIYTTISDELRDVILTADITAYTAWQALKSFFIDNASGREIYLNKAFHGVKQGDMTVVAYCRKLKGIADVGAAVTDKKLTMRLIDGLDKRFKGQQEILEGDVPFPTFMQAQSRLQLAEQKIASHASEPPQILHVNNNNGASSFHFDGNFYTCGAPGHMARDCQSSGGGSQPNRSGGQQHGRGGGPQGYAHNPYSGGYQGYGSHSYNRGGLNGRDRGRGRGRGDAGRSYHQGYATSMATETSIKEMAALLRTAALLLVEALAKLILVTPRGSIYTR
jgi:hypothetical protein